MKTSPQNWQKKYTQRAHRWARILGFFPGVKAIFLSGSLARGDGHQDSDIDFFIVANYGQIWTARFFVFAVLKIFRRLAKPEHHAGNICPNHFITTKNLEIQEQDDYAAQMFSRNIPLYDSGNVWNDFVHANKNWVKKFNCEFANSETGMGFPELQGDSINYFEHWFEQFCKKIQIIKVRHNPDFDRPEGCIVLSDTELRFHPERKNKRTY